MENFQKYKSFINNTNSYLFNDFMIGLVLTNDGLYKMQNAVKSGTCVIVNKKVYRPNHYVIFNNWFEFFQYFNLNKTLIKQIAKRFIFDLEDDNCCADGFICFVNKTPNEYINQQTAVFVPFNTNVHNAIKACFI